MSWERELNDLYEKNEERIGKISHKIIDKNGKKENIQYMLLPIFHTTVAAHIQVNIDEKGNLLDAQKVSTDDRMTMIQTTAESDSRTANPAPHPFCDNIKYLAGDYKNFVKDDKGKVSLYHELYMTNLKKWNESEFSHTKVRAIYEYLKKGTLMNDLIKAKVLELNENGLLSEKIKFGETHQSKAFVRFIVRGDWKKGISDKCWEDTSLQKCFIEYCRNTKGKRELDYLTGKIQQISYLHPKGIVNDGHGAKLISSNDDENFTYRGRFSSKEESFAIGRETSQKLHNALKWIIRKQGKKFDTLTIVTWESSMLEMPSWEEDTEDLFGTRVQTIESNWDGNPNTAQQFYSALEGYRNEISHTERMVLMAFDAATTGRLALVEYKILDDTKYLENIRKWHEQCRWIQTKYRNGKSVEYFGIPGVKDIANILYGNENKGLLSINDKNNRKIYGEIARKLIPCIWDNQKIPRDLVMNAVYKASMPLKYEKNYNWEKVLTLACSFVKKDRYDRNREEWNMSLDKKCRDRNYLYGRLLAVANEIEERFYYEKNDNDNSKRVTNAKRYMTAFSQRPFDTWQVIEENIQPYLSKLNKKNFFESLLHEIHELFDVSEFSKNDRLNGLYLLGYHSQSYELRCNKKHIEGGKEDE